MVDHCWEPSTRHHTVVPPGPPLGTHTVDSPLDHTRGPPLWDLPWGPLLTPHRGASLGTIPGDTPVGTHPGDTPGEPPGNPPEGIPCGPSRRPHLGTPLVTHYWDPRETTTGDTPGDHNL